MATENTETTLGGMTKEVYGEIVDALPSFAVIQQEIQFRKQNKTGRNYNFPVILSREHGWTFAGGNTAGTAFDLEDAEAAVSKEASVDGTVGVGRTKLAYRMLAKAAEKKSKRSFINSTEYIVTNLRESGAFYVELMAIYGGRAISKIESVSGTGTTRTWKFYEGFFAAGVWSQMVNAYLDAYETEALGTKINTNADVKVTGVDISAREVTVSGNSTDLGNVAADDFVAPRGWKSNSFEGILEILDNDGTMFGIDASAYPLWKAPEFSAQSGGVDAPLTMGKVQGALNESVGQGLMDDISFCVPVPAWTDLNTDHAALRRLERESKTKVTLGTRAITYFGPNGEARIKAHPMLYNGKSFGLSPRHWRRIGSSDFTFGLPNHPQTRIFRELESAAGFEMRAFFDQAIICRVPAKQVLITGIDNDSAQ